MARRISRITSGRTYFAVSSCGGHSRTTVLTAVRPDEEPFARLAVLAHVATEQAYRVAVQEGEPISSSTGDVALAMAQLVSTAVPSPRSPSSERARKLEPSQKPRAKARAKAKGKRAKMTRRR
jgi:hypothetical protein